jgi:hypothetical protein
MYASKVSRKIRVNATKFSPFELKQISNTYNVKVKVVPVIFLIEHHAMKAYWGNGGKAPRILDLGTRWR